MWEYQDTEKIIYRYLIPMVCVPGLCAAALSAFVFARMRQTSLDVLLCGLSIFDVFVLSCSLLIYPAMNSCSESPEPLEAAVCHFFWRSTLIVYPLSLMAQAGSVWTCVVITVDRFVAVTFPMQKRLWCTPTTSLSILSVVTIFSILYNLPSIFEIELDEEGAITPTSLRSNRMYVLIYHAYTYVTLMLLLPWTIIITLNCIVIVRVREAYGMRRNLTNTSISTACGGRREESERRCTIMAIVMTATFFVCNFPTGINNLIESFTPYQGVFRHRIPISNLLVCVNSASNMLIYCLFNRKFRRTCLHMIYRNRSAVSEAEKRSVIERTASFMVGGFAVLILLPWRYSTRTNTVSNPPRTEMRGERAPLTRVQSNTLASERIMC